MARDLTDRPIIITGASSGIGAATAVACAEAGMNLVLAARRAGRLAEVAERIRRRGRRVETVIGDVSEPDLSQKLLDVCERSFGRIDAVFANAGYGLELEAIECTDEHLRKIFEVNFFASVNLCREAAARLIERDRPGHLLMCSSCLAKFTMPRYSAYSATKAAQNHICRAMNMELRGRGIHVSSVHPVTTRTEFFEVISRDSGIEADGREVADHARGLFTQRPDRVARAVVKCLRKPKPEVWTSHIVRLTSGVMTMFPRFMDVCVRE